MSPIDMLKPIDTRLGAKPTSREDVVAMDATRRRDRESEVRGYFSHRGIDYNHGVAPDCS